MGSARRAIANAPQGDLDAQYEAAFVLACMMSEAAALEMRRADFGGNGKGAKVRGVEIPRHRLVLFGSRLAREAAASRPNSSRENESASPSIVRPSSRSRP